MVFETDNKVVLEKTIPPELVYPMLKANVDLNRSFVQLQPLGQNKVQVNTSALVTFQLPIEHLLSNVDTYEFCGRLTLNPDFQYDYNEVRNITFHPLLGAYGIINRLSLKGANGERIHDLVNYRDFLGWYNTVRPFDASSECLDTGIVDVSETSNQNYDLRKTTAVYAVAGNVVQVHTSPVVTLNANRLSHVEGFDFRLKLHGLPLFSGECKHLLPAALVGDLRIEIELADPFSSFMVAGRRTGFSGINNNQGHTIDTIAVSSLTYAPAQLFYVVDRMRLEYEVSQAGDQVMNDFASLLADGKQFTTLVTNYHQIPGTLITTTAIDTIQEIVFPIFDTKTRVKAVFMTFHGTGAMIDGGTTTGATDIAARVARRSYSQFSLFEPGSLSFASDRDVSSQARGGIVSVQLVSGSAKNTPIYEITDEKQLFSMYRKALKVCGLRSHANIANACNLLGPNMSGMSGYGFDPAFFSNGYAAVGSYSGPLNNPDSIKTGLFAIGFPLTGSCFNAGPQTMDGTGLDHNMYIKMRISVPNGAHNLTYRTNIYLAHPQLISLARAGVASIRI